MDIGFGNSKVTGLIIVLKGLLVVGVQIMSAFLVNFTKGYKRYFISSNCLLETSDGFPEVLLSSESGFIALSKFHVGTIVLHRSSNCIV